jgi:hypothetical protein
MPIIPSTWRQRQEDQEFRFSLEQGRKTLSQKQNKIPKTKRNKKKDQKHGSKGTVLNHEALSSMPSTAKINSVRSFGFVLIK